MDFERGNTSERMSQTPASPPPTQNLAESLSLVRSMLSEAHAVMTSIENHMHGGIPTVVEKVGRLGLETVPGHMLGQAADNRGEMSWLLDRIRNLTNSLGM